jgi:chaperonin cofactor prefoldin
VPGWDELPCAELIALVREQAGVIAELRAANEALEERVRRLERQVSRNSENFLNATLQ